MFNVSSKASIIVIGNEILSGRTLDKNSNYFAKKCFENGLKLTTILTIEDNESIISQNVRMLSKLNDVVFTSGGVGPTHDDITYASIAKAFDLELSYHTPTIDRMMQIKGASTLNERQKRMALIPFPHDNIWYSKDLWQPLVQVKNVFILPGVMSLFNSLTDLWFEKALPTLNLTLCPLIRISLETIRNESEIADGLEEIALKYPQAEIGSYPKIEGKVTIIVVAGSEHVNQVAEEIRNLLHLKL